MGEEERQRGGLREVPDGTTATLVTETTKQHNPIEERPSTRTAKQEAGAQRRRIQPQTKPQRQAAAARLSEVGPPHV